MDNISSGLTGTISGLTSGNFTSSTTSCSIISNESLANESNSNKSVVSINSSGNKARTLSAFPEIANALICVF